ncbi:uncharacterized protein GLRG_03556 [Colletotrichum graminicola M1.001]|uniref:Uncharacterized protein n=1 Tax=Colletotrichum graminicola (strain M1.001 / M2 / FGSC 10212) TaxID=645133 RepID=E3QBS3_COLGM|nr:uncharacterized protein GLRG_03556 [Colletotrichum graminicola M1.001]EFQ28412.1 hypothetical protein GLRG_03556 [Colletotrichum graminicola M1.001]
MLETKTSKTEGRDLMWRAKDETPRSWEHSRWAGGDDRPQGNLAQAAWAKPMFLGIQVVAREWPKRGLEP